MKNIIKEKFHDEINKIREMFHILIIPHDKANHAFYGLLVYSILAVFSSSLALIVVVLLGVGKEIFDEIDYDGGSLEDAMYTITPPAVVFGIEVIIQAMASYL